MLNKTQKNIILKEMLDKLELPESAYDKAKSRYDDLGGGLVVKTLLLRTLIRMYSHRAPFAWGQRFAL